jgi:hypothetical protein
MDGKERLCPHYTVHPVHIRSCASMHPRYTVHPVHKFKQYRIV